MEKTQYHHGNLKNSIIETSIEIIQKDGIKTLSLRNVAQEIGVSHSALYRHYKSKEDLVVAIAINGFGKLAERLELASEKFSGEPILQIAEMAKSYILYAVENPVYYKVMFGDYIINKTGYPDLFRMYDEMFRKVIDLLVRINEKKKKIVKDYPVTAIAIWSLLHGYSCLILDNNKDKKVGSGAQIDLVIKELLKLI